MTSHKSFITLTRWTFHLSELNKRLETRSSIGKLLSAHKSLGKFHRDNFSDSLTFFWKLTDSVSFFAQKNWECTRVYENRKRKEEEEEGYSGVYRKITKPLFWHCHTHGKRVEPSIFSLIFIKRTQAVSLYLFSFLHSDIFLDKNTDCGFPFSRWGPSVQEEEHRGDYLAAGGDGVAEQSREGGGKDKTTGAVLSFAKLIWPFSTQKFIYLFICGQ